ncbi:MAG: hypothetical protein J6K20_02590 [Thermoguttaceae bacterium]|nr:hypothetical protein [Thermoguttaceae bacterium]
MNADFLQGLVGGVLAGFLVLAPIFARLFGAITRPAPEWYRPQVAPELLAVAREILAEREANGDKEPSENELVETIAERVKGKEKNR